MLKLDAAFFFDVYSRHSGGIIDWGATGISGAEGDSGPDHGNPDYRAWGSAFWFQNVRMAYVRSYTPRPFAYPLFGALDTAPRFAVSSCLKRYSARQFLIPPCLRSVLRLFFRRLYSDLPTCATLSHYFLPLLPSPFSNPALTVRSEIAELFTTLNVLRLSLFVEFDSLPIVDMSFRVH